MNKQSMTGWKVSTKCAYIVRDGEGFQIADCMSDNPRQDYEDAVKVTRLVASAPELLEALKAIAHYASKPENGMPHEYKTLVESAINHAEGRMENINFSPTPDDIDLICRIIARADSMGAMRDRMGMEMDITACHLNGTPLDLEKLLAFDDFNFLHDVGGITQHLDRNTGKLTRCFLPRCAKPAEGK